MNDTAAPYTTANIWNNTEPTDTVINLGSSSGVNGNGNSYICYCWTDIPGYSKFGQYTGNGSSDGTYVHTGFKPALVIAKRTDSTGYWRILDSKRDPDNPAHHALFANTNDGVSDTDGSDQYNTDFLANGFKIRTTLASSNSAGGTWIYMAFADQTSLNQYNLAVNAR